MLFPVSITSKGQINVESPESLSLADILTPCFGKIVWLLLLSDGFQESLRYQESCCLFQFRARMSRALNNFCRAGRIQAPVLVKCLASLANWCGLRAAIQFISITSTEERADMQVSASDHCERTILFPVSIFAKGQINEECLRLQCWKLRKLELGSRLRPCVWKTFSFWCYCVTGFQESYCYQLPGITLPFPVREWAEHRTTLAMLGEQTLALNQCLASLANWWGIRAAIQFTSITSTKHRAHAHVQVSAPLQKVRSMKSVSSAMWRAEKAWAWQTPQTLCWEEL